MSEKNFASYGDMETLVTEIASKCGPYTEITYEDWLQLTPYQQEHGRWDVTGVPGADGTVSIDLMTKLWENPNPSSDFAAQNITLASDDYDLLLIIYIVSTGNSRKCSELTIKGSGATLSIAEYSSNAASCRTRYFTYSSATVYNVSGGYINGTSANNIIIPYQVYGIKLHHTVEMKAIAPSVSTLAENCVFDPTDTDLESTNVEDVIKELEANFQAGVDDIYDAVVAKGSTPASHSLSDVVTGIGNIPTGITPSGTLSITTNGTKDVTNYASANVQVPASAVVSGNKSITANGTNIDVTSYKTVSVSVPTYITTAINAGGNDTWDNGKSKSFSQSTSITLPSGYTKFLVFAASWGDGGAGAITLSSSGRVNVISRTGSNTRSRMSVGMYSKAKTSTLKVTASATSDTSGDTDCCCGLMMIACPVYNA